jgi:AcrR family transcriptional regulator
MLLTRSNFANRASSKALLRTTPSCARRSAGTNPGTQLLDHAPTIRDVDVVESNGTIPGSRRNARERLLDAAVLHLTQHGIGDQSLRQLAAELGTSHRMLIYHFGSKEGLLAEVVRTVELGQRAILDELLADDDLPPGEQGRRFWERAVDPALGYGALFFELAGQAVRDKPHTEQFRAGIVGMWLEPLTRMCLRQGYPPDIASAAARMVLAVGRGLLFDLLASGDRAAVDEAKELFIAVFENGPAALLGSPSGPYVPAALPVRRNEG